MIYKLDDFLIIIINLNQNKRETLHIFKLIHLQHHHSFQGLRINRGGP